MRLRLFTADELIGLRGCEQDAHFCCGEHSVVQAEVLDAAVQVIITSPVAFSEIVIIGPEYGSWIRHYRGTRLNAVNVKRPSTGASGIQCQRHMLPKSSSIEFV